MTDLAERVDRLDRRDAETWECIKLLQRRNEAYTKEIGAISKQVDLLSSLLFTHLGLPLVEDES